MTFDATHYRIRRMGSPDFAAISAICRRVYPHDAPYTDAELATHNALYPEGQFVAEDHGRHVVSITGYEYKSR